MQQAAQRIVDADVVGPSSREPHPNPSSMSWGAGALRRHGRSWTSPAAIGALLRRAPDDKGKSERNKDAGEGASNHPKKKKSKSQPSNDHLVMATERKGPKREDKKTTNHFEKRWNGPCPNHEFPVTLLLKDCSSMKKFVAQESKKGGSTCPDPASKDAEKGDGDDDEEDAFDGFPTANTRLMIFAGVESHESRRAAKLAHREVFAAEPVMPPFLRWSEQTITFDRAHHLTHVPRPGRYPLVVEPIVGDTRLSKVLMDGGCDRLTHGS